MESFRYSRKGQQSLNIASIGQIAITIVLAAIILGLGATILTKIQDTQSDDSASINQTMTWIGNDSIMVFSQDRVDTGSILFYINATLINAGGNFTVDSRGINFTNFTTIWNGTDGNPNSPNQIVTSELNASYNFLIGSTARNTSNFGLDGVNTAAGFVPTVAIVAIAAVVIGVILLFFGRRRIDGG